MKTHPFLLLVNPRIVYSLMFIGTIFYSCDKPSDEAAFLEKAHEIHMEATAIQKEVSKQLQTVAVEGNNLNSIKKRLQNWNKNLVEVPGFEHAHDHSDHDHDHDHGSKFEATPEDMLNIQQEFLDSIQVIQKDLEASFNR